MKRTITMFLSAAILAVGMSTVSAESNVIVGPRYDKIESFSEGLSAIKSDENWGYIGKSGSTVIRPKYYRAASFSEGKAIVAEGDYRSDDIEIGFIDKSGNFKSFIDSNGQVFSMPRSNMYSEEDFRLFSFHNGLAHLYTEKDGEITDSRIFDVDGREVKTSTSNSEDVFFIGKYNEGLIPAIDTARNKLLFTDRDGQEVLSFDSYQDIYQKDGIKRIVDIRGFNQGLAPAAQAYISSGNLVVRWGFIDKTGKFKIAPKYSDFYSQDLGGLNEVFNDGIASVQDSNTGLWGAIDIEGRTVVEFKYEKLYAFQEGLAGGKLPGDRYFSFIGRNGNAQISSTDLSSNGDRLSLITPFTNGVAIGHDSNTNETFAIKQNPNSNGDFKIEAGDNLSKDMYFENGEDGIIYSPEQYMIIERDGLQGIVENDFDIGAPPKALISDWAYGEVIESIEGDLVPKSLQNQYRESISREDFSALVVNIMEEETGKSIENMVREDRGRTLDYFVARYPFTDTVNRDVVAANALGIIEGIGDNKFAPYDYITRQDAATLLMRVGRYLEGESSVEGVDFKDSNDISSYAVKGVNYVSHNRIMYGVGNQVFSPKTKYTRQQAYITLYRLSNSLN